MTDLFFDKEARDKLLLGAEKLYNAVKTTLGPRGRNVVIGKRGFGPTVTHDGVTVAKAVHVKDEGENIGAELIKEAANKLNDVAGDGTTTVTVLTYHLLKAAADMVEKENINPMILAREVEAALDGVIEYLEKNRLPADDLETLQKIATISSGSEEIGKVVAETVHAVGPTGTVDVEAVAKLETTSELASGFQLGRGWLSPYMVNKENTMEAIYDDPAIIVLHRRIYSFREILPVLEKVQAAGINQAVIVAIDVEGDALPSLILNSQKGVFRTLVIKAPGVGAQQRRILDDLAYATGATVIAQDSGVALENATAEHIGRAKRVIASREKTTFIDVGGDLEGRIKQLTEQIEGAGSEYDRELLEKRRASLEGKVAKIHVGGQTETEIEEKKFRVDDAVAATKAAAAEGILPGGGTVLYHAPVKGKTDGARLLKQVLQEPFRQLIANSGMDVKEAENDIKANDGLGINVKTGKLVPLVQAGIVDPFTVTRQALATSVSLGVVGMTTGALIVEEEK